MSSRATRNTACHALKRENIKDVDMIGPYKMHSFIELPFELLKINHPIKIAFYQARVNIGKMLLLAFLISFHPT